MQTALLYEESLQAALQHAADGRKPASDPPACNDQAQAHDEDPAAPYDLPEMAGGVGMDSATVLQNFAAAECVELDLDRNAAFGTEAGTPALLGSWFGGAGMARQEFDRDTGLAPPAGS